MWQKFFIICLFLCFVPPAHARVAISEIMYNPAGEENNFEYIELMGENDSVAGWYFEGIDFIFSNVTIDGIVVIARTAIQAGEQNDLFDRYGINTSFEYKGSLKNTGEVLLLRNKKGDIMDVVVYDDWAEENHSIEKLQMWEMSSPLNWAESIPGGTPGAARPEADEGCDWGVSVHMNDSITTDPAWQVITEKKTGPKTNFTLIQWIENNEGIVKLYEPLLLENVERRRTLSYSPNLPAGDGYMVRASIFNFSCEDKDAKNNNASVLIFVPSDEKNVKNESSIAITDIGKARFGEIMDVDLSIYRADTQKYSLQAYVKGKRKVSEESTIHIKTSFVNTTLRIPLMLKDDCDEGPFQLVVNGLGVVETRDVEIECPEVAVQSRELQRVEKNEKQVKKQETKKPQKFNVTLYAPSEGRANATLPVALTITNDEPQQLTIEAYVSKTGSIVSEKNVMTLVLGLEQRKLNLSVFIDSRAKSGIYKVRAHILKEGRKTPIEVTQNITIIQLKALENDRENRENNQNKTENETKIVRTELFPELRGKRGTVIYESTEVRAYKSLPYFLTVSLALLVIVLAFKKV